MAPVLAPLLTRLDRRGMAAPDADLPRPSLGGDEPVDAVRAILDDVAARGDEAVRDHTERLDGVRLDELRVPAEALADALDRVAPDVRAALETAAAEVGEYHAGQVPPTRRHDRGGVVIDEYYVPVARAGCYVPGGRARYPSTVLMTVVPAKAAGVEEVVLVTPPGPDGTVPVETLAAAAVAGADEVYRVGGAQAIGALAHGTESVRPVDVVVGPGNVYVSQAKRQVAGLVGVPAAFAGPSEVVVIGDDSVPAELCAIDIVVQAEHGPGGLAWLVTWDEAVADAVDAAIGEIVGAADRRADIESTLADGGYTVLVDGPDEAMAVANAIAPEHLQLMTAEPATLVPKVRNAGAVFCGPWSPASLGDYTAGPSHVLPTFGSARYAGALSVLDFLKQIHVVSADAEGLARLGPVVETLATAEGLTVHAASIAARRR
ncbi:MAG TPA: histidinol dehydrogenase [Acidimicrobiales bacterium]|nr:histidinol dehydrogenase [Acidimicrobiales bacterium]